MKPLIANASMMNQIQQLLHQMLTVEGAPALSSEQVQGLLEQIRLECGLPPYPWTEDFER